MHRNDTNMRASTRIQNVDRASQLERFQTLYTGLSPTDQKIVSAVVMGIHDKNAALLFCCKSFTPTKAQPILDSLITQIVGNGSTAL